MAIWRSLAVARFRSDIKVIKSDLTSTSGSCRCQILVYRAKRNAIIFQLATWLPPTGKISIAKIGVLPISPLFERQPSNPTSKRVLVNAAIKKELCRVEANNDKPWMSKVRPWYGHADHIHVRLKRPADLLTCRAQPAVPSGNGCDKSLSSWFADWILRLKIQKFWVGERFET